MGIIVQHNHQEVDDGFFFAEIIFSSISKIPTQISVQHSDATLVTLTAEVLCCCSRGNCRLDNPQ